MKQIRVRSGQEVKPVLGASTELLMIIFSYQFFDVSELMMKVVMATSLFQIFGVRLHQVVFIQDLVLDGLKYRKCSVLR